MPEMFTDFKIPKDEFLLSSFDTCVRNKYVPIDIIYYLAFTINSFIFI